MLLLVFALIFIFFIAGCNYNRGDRTSDNRIHLLFVLVSFVILQILRVYCQKYFPDIPEYKDLFQKTPSLFYVLSHGGILKNFGTETTLEVEPGFNVFMSFVKCFTSSYSCFLFTVSIIEWLSLYFFCKKAKINYLAILPVYVCLTYTAFQIGMLRQALAFCILLFAIICIKKKLIFLILMIVGFSFHRSMLFCLLLIWVDKYLKPKFIIGLFIFSLLIYLFQIEIISDVWGRFLADDSNRVNFYLGVDRANNYLGIGFWERVLEFVVTSAFYFKIRNNNMASDGQCISKKFSDQSYFWRMNVLYNLGLSLIVLQMIFFSSPTITSRLRYYVVLFPVFFLSEYIRNEIPKGKKMVYLIPLFIYLTLYMFTQSGYLRGIIDNV